MPHEVVNNKQTFLLNLLKAIANHQNQQVKLLLQQNLDQLNKDFALLLRQWATDQFAKDSARAINIARIIIKFSKFIHSFEQGDAVSNLEIAIAGYEVVLQNCQREAFPQEYDDSQQALMMAYQQRQNILTISELRQNLIQIQAQIHNITESFQNELEFSKRQLDDLKTIIQVKPEATNSEFNQELTSLRAEFRELKQQNITVERFATQFNLSRNIEQFNTGIFYDIENLTMGSRNPNLQNFSLEKIREQIKEFAVVNKIAIQCAYADWSNHDLKRLKNHTQKLGIETIQIFDFGYKKNAADIQLAIDAMELAHSRPTLQVFVIVSGDGAFASLAKKLHEYAKTVIGCGYHHHTNNILAAVCDHFIWLPVPEIEANNNYKAILDSFKVQEPYCSYLKQDGISLNDVKKVFTEKMPDLNYKQLGFPKFKTFLNSVCQGTEYIIDDNQCTLKLKQTPKQRIISHLDLDGIAAS